MRTVIYMIWMVGCDEELMGRYECEQELYYMDPVLRNNVKAYVSFLVQLYQCGVIRFSSSTKVTNGIFLLQRKTDVYA